MSLLLLPDELLGELFVVLANDDPRDAVALAFTCRQLFAVARTDVSRFSVGHLFPVAPFHPDQLPGVRRHVATTVRLLAAATRVRHVALTMRQPALAAVAEPPAARDRRRDEAERLFRRLLDAVRGLPVASVALDEAVVRLLRPATRLSTPATAVRALAIHDTVDRQGVDAAAQALLDACGASLRRLTVRHRVSAGAAGVFVGSGGIDLRRWFGAAAALPALADLTVHAMLYSSVAARLPRTCPALQRFTLWGRVGTAALLPLALPAWPRLAAVAIRYARWQPDSRTGIVHFLRGRFLPGGLRVDTTGWEQPAGSGPVDGIGAKEVRTAVAGMRERPSPLVVDLPNGLRYDVA